MYAIIDVETTGTNFRREKITEIAIFLHDGQCIVEEFVTLVNPECTIPWEISRMTGITNEMVRHGAEVLRDSPQGGGDDRRSHICGAQCDFRL